MKCVKVSKARAWGTASSYVHMDNVSGRIEPFRVAKVGENLNAWWKFFDNAFIDSFIALESYRARLATDSRDDRWTCVEHTSFLYSLAIYY